MTDPHDLGRRVGRTLSENRLENSGRGLAAKFVAGIFEEFPDVKLPAIMAFDGVLPWMETSSVSEAHLREALRLARKDRRELHKNGVTSARRPQRKPAEIEQKALPKVAHRSAPVGFDFDDGMVPNTRR